MLAETRVQGLGEFSRWGFTLEHPDDHVLLLLHEGVQVAAFSQTGATQESLQEECARHLEERHYQQTRTIQRADH